MIQISDATGTTTTNYTFKTLAGTDTAGYTSINSIVTSIDTKLLDKTFIAGMIILYEGVAAPSGWTIITPATIYTGTEPTLEAGYIYIKKNV